MVFGCYHRPMSMQQKIQRFASLEKSLGEDLQDFIEAVDFSIELLLQRHDSVTRAQLLALLLLHSACDDVSV